MADNSHQYLCEKRTYFLLPPEEKNILVLWCNIHDLSFLYNLSASYYQMLNLSILLQLCKSLFSMNSITADIIMLCSYKKKKKSLN